MFTRLSRSRDRHVALWYREPAGLEALLALERPDVEHMVDGVDGERADGRAPETTSVQSQQLPVYLHMLQLHLQEFTHCIPSFVSASYYYHEILVSLNNEQRSYRNVGNDRPTSISLSVNSVIILLSANHSAVTFGNLVH